MNKITPTWHNHLDWQKLVAEIRKMIQESEKKEKKNNGNK